MQKYQQQLDELRDELTAARAEIKSLRSVPQAFPGNLAEEDDEILFVSRESHGVGRLLLLVSSMCATRFEFSREADVGMIQPGRLLSWDDNLFEEGP